VKSKSKSEPSKPRPESGASAKRRSRRPPRRRAKAKPIPAGPRRPDARFAAILAQIGVPEDQPFQPDPFQIEAVERLDASDVLVSAPTGTGKTWIAEQAIRKCLQGGGHAWYACPLKALSNAKMEEFGKVFGPENVGIVTGDRKENAHAPLIVGTTEILRNQLYDCMWHKTPLPYELVILDEAHYLGEIDRGVVWEETLIYVPASTRLLLLSATIRNTNELASWLDSIRGVECAVVVSEERPVPLYPLFLYPDGQIGMLSGKKGLLRDVERCLEALSQRRGRRPQAQPYDQIIERLRRYNLLPAIFFLKSRADCDRATDLFGPKRVDPEEQAAFQRDLDESLERYPALKDHRAMPHLVEGRVAAHHAGHLPYWKVLVEQMMAKGHLDAIFATSTVAGGVDFPARTVALVQSDRFDGTEFQDLSATDLQQMIGRAGRRGKDRVGFALVIPGPYNNPKLIHQRLRSPPDAIESQIRINFSMVLNLLQSHNPEEVRVLIDRSLAAFQQARRLEARRKRGGRVKKDKVDVCEALWQDFLRHMVFLQGSGFVDDDAMLTWEGQWAAQLRLDHPLLVAEAIRKGSFDGAPPEIVAAMIAPFVVDSDRSDELDRSLTVRAKDLSRRLDRMRKDLKDLSRQMKRSGFEISEIPVWPALAAYLWAKGVSWTALLKAVPLEEGAMSMMIMRTADHLNQIVGLRQSHPELAETASEAIPLIFREPVWM
jgi:superfamily II RNA helicase